MIITYADGTTVEALLLSSEGSVMRLAVAGDEGVRLLKRMGGSWRAEDGHPVEVQYSWQADRRVPLPEESQFICSTKVARQLVSNLINGPEPEGCGSDAFYVFSAENRRVRVTLLRRAYRIAS
jgi:hypothetical protein